LTSSGDGSIFHAVTDGLNSTVPRETADPIGYLLDKGLTLPELAVKWGFKTTDTIYRLKRFEYVPPAGTAQKMAESFGWTAGEVVDHWLAEQARRAAERQEATA
jgi:hypothetical protein